MYFPKGRHLDSISCIRTIHSNSGSDVGVWRLSGNASGNVKKLEEDRVLHEDINNLAALAKEGMILQAAERVVGRLK
jgi:hypothetical protein